MRSAQQPRVLDRRALQGGKIHEGRSVTSSRRVLSFLYSRRLVCLICLVRSAVHQLELLLCLLGHPLGCARHRICRFGLFRGRRRRPLSWRLRLMSLEDFVEQHLARGAARPNHMVARMEPGPRYARYNYYYYLRTRTTCALISGNSGSSWRARIQSQIQAMKRRGYAPEYTVVGHSADSRDSPRKQAILY